MSLGLLKGVLALLIAYGVYRGAKRSKMWDWWMFFQVIGLVLGFGLVFVGGMVYLDLPQRHPGVFFTLFFVGLGGFAVGLTVLSKRMTSELRRRQALAAAK